MSWQVPVFWMFVGLYVLYAAMVVAMLVDIWT